MTTQGGRGAAVRCMLPSSISTEPSGSFVFDLYCALPVTTAMSPKIDVLGATPSASCFLRIGPTMKRSDSARPARKEPVAIHVPSGNLDLALDIATPGEAGCSQRRADCGPNLEVLLLGG